MTRLRLSPVMFFCLCMLALALAACAQKAPFGNDSKIPETKSISVERVIRAVPTPEQSLSTSNHYRHYVHKVEPGEVLSIAVYGEEELSRDYAVDAGGMISFPFIGSMKVAGLSEAEIASVLTAALKDGYLKNPKVNVVVKKYEPIYVMGAVNKPGSYPYTARVNALKAIALAGGYKMGANQNSYKVIRGEGAREKQVRAHGDTRLHPGDVLIVKEGGVF